MNTPVNAALPLVPADTPGWVRFAQSLAEALAQCARRLGRPAPHQVLGADELRAMGDLDLKDLGIGRSEIAHALREGPNRP